MSANLRLLANTSFLGFLGFRTSMVLGFQVVGTIAHWQVYSITHDSIYIGYLALTEVIPAIALSLLGGYWADSFNRRTVALIGSAITLISTTILVGGAAINEAASILPLFIAVAIIGLGRGILAPASAALLGEIVDPHFYARAAVFNSIVWHMALITGPAMAGILYEKYSPLLCYRVAFILTALSIVFLWFISAAQRPVGRREKISESIREGLRFVLHTRIILGAMSLDMFAVLFGGAVALLPAFSDAIYKTGAEGLGYLRAAPAVGAAIMGLILIFIPIRHNAGKVLLVAVALFGITMIAFGLNSDFTCALLILALSGGVDNISVVMRSTIMQTHTPDPMRGRVAAVNSIFIASSNELGAFESGVTAKFMGLVPAVVFGGAMTVVVVVVIAFLIPELRRLSFAGTQK